MSLVDKRATTLSVPPHALRIAHGSLTEDRVHVWIVRLDEAAAKGDQRILSADEAARAERFHFDRDRQHFSRCRVALRLILAEYLAVPASSLRLLCSKNGKPDLDGRQNPESISFNVSHSANMALIAIGKMNRLGVDIEKMRPDVDVDSLAERFFSRRERSALQALPKNLLLAAFFACWTRKEAFLKATGDGLSFPLEKFSVTTHPDVAPKVEEIDGDIAAGKRWFLADLNVREGFRAALAFEGSTPGVEIAPWN